MARLASTPSPALTLGARTSSNRPVPVPMSSSRPSAPAGNIASKAASTSAAGKPSARISSQSAPCRRNTSDAMRARSARTPRRRSSIGGQHRVLLGKPGQQFVDQPGLRRQSEPNIRPFAHALEHPGVTEQLKVARQTEAATAPKSRSARRRRTHLAQRVPAGEAGSARRRRAMLRGNHPWGCT